jgi:hypothetical protein
MLVVKGLISSMRNTLLLIRQSRAQTIEMIAQWGEKNYLIYFTSILGMKIDVFECDVIVPT